MFFDLQKASIWKRISAYIFDGILVGVLIAGFAFLLSMALNYDGYNQRLNDAYHKYETEYGIVFEITEEQYYSMSEAELEQYDEAYDALLADKDAMYAYDMVVNLTMVITTISILLGFVALEFVVPLSLGNGQTLGKKIFGIGLMRTDGVKINTMQLFVRAILGKYTIETMIPVYIVIMIFFNTLGLIGTIVLGLILLVQIILLIATHTNALIHDLLAGTVAVDISSQMIFNDTEELIAYKKRMHQEKVARQEY